MSIFDNLKSFSFDSNRKQMFGCKSGIVWGHSNKTNGIYPILYISKPGAISQEDYEELLDCIEINFVRK